MSSSWIAWVVIGFVSLAGPAYSQTLPEQESAPRGLDSLRVEVTLAGRAANAGVTETAVRNHVEGRLRETGLQVRQVDDLAVRGDPRLLVTVHTISVTGGYAFMVSVQFIERVVSLRRYVDLVLSDGLPSTPAASVEPLQLADGVRWQARALGTTRPDRAPAFVAEAVLEYVDRFVTDFRAANLL